MDVRAGFYRHPYASMVTAVFCFSLLVTALYFFGLIPGTQKSEPGFNRLLVISGLLLVVTGASWIAAIALRPGDA